MHFRRFSILAFAFVTLSSLSSAQALLGNTPQLNSRAGAAYTLFLDFSGFQYTGTWGGGTPGTRPAFDGATGSFSTVQADRIKKIWASVAERYTPFNINVTTVDPAATAGQASTYLQRQQYYQTTAKMMQTLITGTNSWFSPGAGGVSYVGTTAGSWPANSQYHTNWVFPGNLGNDKNVGEATIHENGHGLGLDHHVDVNASGVGINNYSTNSGASGNGSFAPLMGVTYSSQRGLWAEGRVGSSGSATTNQDDVDELLNNPGMSLFDSGIGHTLFTATNVIASGGNLVTGANQGFLAPKLTAGLAEASGDQNYTRDFFKFRTAGGLVNFTVNFGSDRVTEGVADGGIMLDANLTIRNAQGNIVATGVRSGDTLRNTFSGNLSAGDYFAEISNVGGYTSTLNGFTRKFYTFGSYFLSGSNIQAVPEPTTLALLGLGLAGLARKRRKS